MRDPAGPFKAPCDRSAARGQHLDRLGAWVRTGNQRGAAEGDSAPEDCDLGANTTLSGQERPGIGRYWGHEASGGPDRHFGACIGQLAQVVADRVQPPLTFCAWQAS